MAIEPTDFLRKKVIADLESNKFGGKVVTRFPPEPNGFLHIGHAKAIVISFGIAAEHPGGITHLRFDDTNPVKEDIQYTKSIMADIQWLGFDWGDRLHYASDYFDQLHEWAIRLIKKGLAYIDDQTADEMRATRGTLTEPGEDSPYRDRSIEENLDLFERMTKGEFSNGAKTLRAKVDMENPNLNMRDPVMYRILHATHHQTGDKWCIYPMYDWAHGQSDSIEGITHSLCSLEFEAHRPLYNWFLKNLEVHHSEQTEFARLNMTYTVMSKRKLMQLVDDNHVSGWDDPRMPTLSGLRRRGYTPSVIREFIKRVGISKANSTVDFSMLESCLREELNKNANRFMGVLKPLKVVIDNYPDDQIEELEGILNPEDPEAGKREIPFSNILYIEQDDFMEDPPKKFFRLAPGCEVRLRYAYFVTCTDVTKDENGNITEVHCTYDPATRGGDSPDGRKVKGTLHWVSKARAVDAEVRLYDHLFNEADPLGVKDGRTFLDCLNPSSLEILTNCKIEPALLENLEVDDQCQFERLGYFCIDSKDSTKEKPVFNRISTLRDTWAKIQKQDQNQPKKSKPKKERIKKAPPTQEEIEAMRLAKQKQKQEKKDQE
jgi:glutaminyl-tRNA synthetase